MTPQHEDVYSSIIQEFDKWAEDYPELMEHHGSYWPSVWMERFSKVLLLCAEDSAFFVGYLAGCISAGHTVSNANTNGASVLDGLVCLTTQVQALDAAVRLHHQLENHGDAPS